MSFREKSAWISFVSIGVVFTVYFWNVARVLAGEVESREIFIISIGLLAAFVVLEIALHIAVALQSPAQARTARDERERLIEMKATRPAFHVLVIGALAGVGMIHVTSSTWLMSQVVLLAIVVAELVKFGGQIIYFRQGV